MYKKSAQGWLKHWDFELFDLLCMQICLIFAHIMRHGLRIPYESNFYFKLVIMFAVSQIFVAFFGQPYKNILKRGYYVEFTAVFKQDCMVMLLVMFYLFATKESQQYSRISLIAAGFLYLCICYLGRLLLKKYIKSRFQKKEDRRSLILISDENFVEQAVEDLLNSWDWKRGLCGIALLDTNRTGESIRGIPIVGDSKNVVDYICREWVDEVLIRVSAPKMIPKKITNALVQMGVTVHVSMSELVGLDFGERHVEKIGNSIVLTSSIRMTTPKQMFYKRTLDIIGGILGCLITGILFVFIAPAIYMRSPGPIFFSQTRIGKNGRKFKMYKFRSMYMDAEERKKELIEHNKIKDGFMFKVECDPRIIGSEKIKRNGEPGGIGNFIRKTSIDEFPQFWNVLKGDMSLVGTRPPTLDEWEKYELHHRVRMAIKPGITGMWQISGRSEITDFEEVVRLDTEYIERWNIGLDIKILLLTVVHVLKNDGAM